MCGKNFQIHGVHTHAPPQSKIAPSSSYHALGRRKLLFLPGRNLLPPTDERGEENYDLLHQNSIRKYMKMTWNIKFFIFCMIWNFFQM